MLLSASMPLNASEKLKHLQLNSGGEGSKHTANLVRRQEPKMVRDVRGRENEICPERSISYCNSLYTLYCVHLTIIFHQAD